ncbi:MAG: hypothetical protein AAF675_02010 [Pseudomonadota bacterium]
MRTLTAIALAAALLAPAVQAAAQATLPEPLDERQAVERFGAIRDMLDEAAEARARAERGDTTMVEELLRQTPRDRANDLLAEAFAVVADQPVTRLQQETAAARSRIAAAREQIARLREEKLFAPEETTLWQGLQGQQDREGVEEAIAALEAEIADDEALIAENRRAFIEAMAGIGTPISPEQADLLLGGVTGGDIIAIAAAYDVVRDIAAALRKVVAESGEEASAARRYYTLHTTLIALLAHAQETFIIRVEEEYLPKLDAIEAEVAETRAETERLLADGPSAAQRRVLETNRESQALSLKAARLYRRFLERQRDAVAERLYTTRRDLAVADNTLRTVDASFRLLEIMRAARLEFEALDALESPGLDTLFENEALRREFEVLSDRLRGPSS